MSSYIVSQLLQLLDNSFFIKILKNTANVNLKNVRNVLIITENE